MECILPREHEEVCKRESCDGGCGEMRRKVADGEEEGSKGLRRFWNLDDEDNQLDKYGI